MNLPLLKTIQDHLSWAAQQSILATEAELLLAFSLNKPRSYIRAWADQAVPQTASNWFTQSISRRANGEPIAYLTGQREFWSLTLQVSPMTLIPRPETELLVETLLTLFPNPNDNLRLADLGTGSGAIALALASERKQATIIATDQSTEALTIAKQNAQQLGFTNIQFHHGHWCQALPPEKFDAILSNPPYLSESEWPTFESGLAYEPKSALVATENGLADIREIIETAAAHLKPNGYLLMEHGYQQAQQVQALMHHAGYQTIHSHKDLAGIERITVGRRPSIRCYAPTQGDRGRKG